MMYSGIDLHSNNSVVAVIDDGDRVVAQKRLPNDIVKITGFLARWQDELAGVVVEFDLQLVLAGRWIAGRRPPCASREHGGDQAVRRTEAQRRRDRCAAPCHLLRLGIHFNGTAEPKISRILECRVQIRVTPNSERFRIAVDTPPLQPVGSRPARRWWQKSPVTKSAKEAVTPSRGEGRSVSAEPVCSCAFSFVQLAHAHPVFPAPSLCPGGTRVWQKTGDQRRGNAIAHPFIGAGFVGPIAT